VCGIKRLGGVVGGIRKSMTTMSGRSTHELVTSSHLPDDVQVRAFEQTGKTLTHLRGVAFWLGSRK
jgi:hypothetical protein